MDFGVIPEDFDLLAFVDGNGPNHCIPELDDADIWEILADDNLKDIQTSHSFIPPNYPRDNVSSNDSGTTKRCPICGGSAGKHCYYGANTCSGCRMFFQRAVKSNKIVQQTCSKGGTCSTIVIPSSSPRSRVCKVCRFQKCLEVGMKPSYVVTGRQTINKSSPSDYTRSKKIVEDSGKSFPLERRGSQMMFVFTLEERNVYVDEFTQLITKSYNTVIDFYSVQPVMFDILVKTVFQGQTSDSNSLKCMTKLDEDILMQYCMGNPDFEQLYFHDRMLLIHHNFPILFGFMWSVFCMPEFLTDYLGGLVRHLNHGANKKGKQLISPLQKSERTKLTQGVEKMTNESDPLRLVKNMHQIQDWVKATSDPSRDNVLIVLILKVFLFSTEFGHDKLKNGPKIKACHQKYLFQLHRYLKQLFHESANSRLHQLFLMSLCAKDVFNALQSLTINL
ncbi:nuclear hormone receptor family member nhr-10-like [Tigriopus californicus]|uniref:nuclear hormone receptor family member nhr-10-like n=1 Tax=Tigriopus californicus TaxID=6832 RepID=UPI0027DA6CAF|nr:nuclear hormone receptor family member nhr-10-like [Tigriopus californicus]